MLQDTARFEHNSHDNMAKSLPDASTDTDSESGSSSSEDEEAVPKAGLASKWGQTLQLPQKPAIASDEKTKWHVYKDPARHLLVRAAGFFVCQQQSRRI